MIPHHHINSEQQKTKHPIGKARYVGTSVVLTLHPSHVKELDMTLLFCDGDGRTKLHYGEIGVSKQHQTDYQ